MDIDFDWDETKRQANRRKHGVDFADAAEAFCDDLSCSMPDPDHRGAALPDHRHKPFGRVLLVVYAQPEQQTSRIKLEPVFRTARPRLPSVDTTSKADPMRDEYYFNYSRRGATVKSNKERITIRLDPDIIEWFHERVRGGGNYQTLIDEALREHIQR
jgi:uncharacterized DUF497 family protein